MLRKGKQIRRFISLLLVIVVAFTAIPDVAFAATNESDGITSGKWQYRVITDTDTDEGTAKITGYVGDDKLTVEEVTVPATFTYEGKDIPVTSIDASGHPIFPAGNSVKKLIFSEGMKVIGGKTFDNLSNLAEIQLSDTIEVIGTDAFNSCPIEGELVLPKNLKEIGVGAFQSTNISSVNFSKCTQLEVIGSCAFWRCKNFDKIDLSKNTALTSIEDRAFYECTSLTTVIMPASDKLVSFDYGIFYGDTKLQDIDLSVCTGITKLSDTMFCGCSALSSLNLPDTLTEIGKGTFKQSGLETISFPVSLKVIGEEAFDGSKLAGKIVVPSNIETINKGAFQNCDSITSIDLSNSTITSVPESFCYNDSFLEEIIFSENIKSVGKEAFGRTAIEKLSLPDSITDISEGAFYDNKKLTTVTWPKNVDFKVIGDSAFKDCILLTNETLKALPSTITQIGKCSFYNCQALTELDLTALTALEKIDESAFQSNIYIESIKLPDTALELGADAFFDCERLTQIKWPDNEGFTMVTGFAKCYALGSDIIKNLPSSVKEIGGVRAFGNCSFTSVEIPDQIERIGNSAFSGCTELTSVSLGKNLKSIDEKAFEYCTSLEAIEWNEGLTFIGKSAFSNCRSLTKNPVVIPKSVKTLSDLSFERIGSETEHVAIYLNGANTEIEQTTEDSGIKVEDAYYAYPFKNSYVHLYAYLYDDNGDDTFIKKYCDALADAATTDDTIHVTLCNISLAPVRPTATIGDKVIDESAPKENSVTAVYGDKLVLNCATEGAKIYYTTDNTSPCQNTDARKEYTGPITLTEDTYFSIAAYKEGMDYSDRLNITVTVHKHSYGNPVYSWSADGETCKATFKCSCGDTVALDAEVTQSVLKDSTYTSNGTTRYTAKVTFEEKTYTDYKDIENIAKKTPEKITISASKIGSVQNTSKGITVKWSKVSGVTGYYLYRSTDGKTFKKYKTIKGASKVSYTDTGAKTNGRRYVYKVAAYKKVSGVTYVSALSKAKTAYRLSASSVKKLKNSAKGTLDVQWGKNAKATGYVISYTIGKTTKTVTVKKATTLKKKLTKLKKGTYKVKIRVYKQVGKTKYYSAWSTVKSVKVKK